MMQQKLQQKLQQIGIEAKFGFNAFFQQKRIEYGHLVTITSERAYANLE